MNREIKGFYKALFSIDGNTDEAEVVEGYSDGTTWNGWANIFLPKDQLIAWIAASPYKWELLNDEDQTLRIHWDDRDEDFPSTPIPTENGTFLVGYDMNGYCFDEIVRL